MDRIVRDLTQAGFEGELVAPSHADYDRLRRVWNAMADRRPGLVVRPRHAADVQRVVRAAAGQAVSVVVLLVLAVMVRLSISVWQPVVCVYVPLLVYVLPSTLHI